MSVTDRRTLLGGLAAFGLLGGRHAEALGTSAYIGIWSGVIPGGVHLRLVIKSETAASLMSLVLGGYEFTSTAMTLTADGLHMDFGDTRGSYDGKLNGDIIKGAWTPRGQPAVALDFTRGDPLEDVRPVPTQ